MDEIQKEAVKNQKEQVKKELATYKLHLGFKTDFWKEQRQGATKKEDVEQLAHQQERDVSPIKQNIILKEKYLQWLESLDMESPVEVNTDDTSEEPSETSENSQTKQ